MGGPWSSWGKSPSQPASLSAFSEAYMKAGPPFTSPQPVFFQPVQPWVRGPQGPQGKHGQPVLEGSLWGVLQAAAQKSRQREDRQLPCPPFRPPARRRLAGAASACHWAAQSWEETTGDKTTFSSPQSRERLGELGTSNHSTGSRAQSLSLVRAWSPLTCPVHHQSASFQGCSGSRGRRGLFWQEHWRDRRGVTLAWAKALSSLWEQLSAKFAQVRQVLGGGPVSSHRSAPPALPAASRNCLGNSNVGGVKGHATTPNAMSPEYVQIWEGGPISNKGHSNTRNEKVEQVFSALEGRSRFQVPVWGRDNHPSPPLSHEPSQWVRAGGRGLGR